MILHIIEVRLTGLQLPGQDLSPFLQIGLTSASLKSDGNFPSKRVRSNKIFNGLAKLCDVHFKNLGCILSGPGDLFGFKFDKAYSNSFTVTVQLVRQSGVSPLY